jgi:hypothetical protein
MSKRGAGWPIVVAWVTGIVTAGGALDGLFINNVNGGLDWKVGAVILTVAVAALAGWLAYRGAGREERARREEQGWPAEASQGPASVSVTDGSQTGDISTQYEGYRDLDAPALDAAAVRVQKSRTGSIRTKATERRPGRGKQR